MKTLILRIDEETKGKFTSMVRMEGKTISGKLREMISEHIRANDPAVAVDMVWRKVAARMRERGLREDDLEKAIREVRSTP